MNEKTFEEILRGPPKYKRVEYPVGGARLRWRNEVLEQQWVITIYDGHETNQIEEWRLVPMVAD